MLWGFFLALLSTLNTLLDRFVSCVCVCKYVCVWMLNSVYVCFLISVAATRSYSRSTGALHTPDAFGAAGEGWVHLFLCTSPTHFALIFVRSVLFLFSFVPRIFSCISSTFFSFRVHWPLLFFFIFKHSVPGCRTCQWNCMFPPVQLPVDNHPSSLTRVHLFSLFSSVPSLLGHPTRSPVFYVNHSFSHQWHLQCPLTSHQSHQLTGLAHEKCSVCGLSECWIWGWWGEWGT